MKQTEKPQGGYSIYEWCAATKISRATYYKLVGSLQPRFARIGRRVVICEDPRAYLDRIAAEQARAA